MFTLYLYIFKIIDYRKVYEDKEYPLVMTTYLSIVSRILLLDQVVFSNVLQEMNTTQSLEKILDAWITKMSLVTQLEKRKLLSRKLRQIIIADFILINICVFFF